MGVLFVLFGIILPTINVICAIIGAWDILSRRHKAQKDDRQVSKSNDGRND